MADVCWHLADQEPTNAQQFVFVVSFQLPYWDRIVGPKAECFLSANSALQFGTKLLWKHSCRQYNLTVPSEAA